jgi:phosphodiesterase/alkaline phosphatase D-like protein
MKTIKFKIKITLSVICIIILASGFPLTGQSTGESGSDGISTLKGTPDGIVSPATSITGTTATLNGLVNPNNESTTVTFEYSEDSNFGEESVVFTVTADQSPLTGNGYMAVSKAISGLTPGTTYHFRIISVNGTATDTSTSTNFTTSLPATVTTGVASPVTTTTATLNGTVNAENNSTTVTFEYGLTTSYGTTVTADQSPVTGTSDTAVSKGITGLTPNTTYHFRVVGVNALGTSNGDDMTFFTSAQAAPTATTEDATYNAIGSPNTANLKGTVNANNADATVTFEYGLTTAYGTTVTADQSPVPGSTDTAVSKTISGLTADTTYHYRVVATNSQGTTNGADMTFYNTAAPYARTDAAIPIGLTTATLNGTVNPKRFDDSEDTTVTFDYGLTNAYGSSATAIQSPLSAGVEQSVSFQLTGLTANTTYHYRVTATSPSGTGTGADTTFTTSSLPIVTTNSATPVGTTTATLNGEVNANGDNTTVTFEYGTTTSYGTTVTADQSPVTGTTDTWVSKAISGLTNGTTYHYRVVGTNSSGTSNGDDITFTTGVTPPSATTDAATSVGTNSATMNGTINANGITTNVTFEYGFTTSYGITAAGIPSPVSGSTNTAVIFNATSLIPNTTYHYRVVAQSAGGTIYGADMTFTTAATPTVTTNAASSVTTSGATLNGTVNANNQSSTVTFEYGTTTSYGTTVTADQSPVTGSSSTAVSKAISGLTMNTTYHYRVVGQNASGTSYGADMTFFTSAPAAPSATTDAATSVTASGATLNGTVNANNDSTSVTFEYGTTVAYGTTVTADQSPVTGSSSTAVSKAISGLSNNTTYHYRVVATNANGTTNGADMTFTTNALTPSAITGTASNVLFTSATVNGTANGNNAGATVTFEYGLTVAYGTTVSATPSSVPGDSTDYAVSANLTGLTPGTTYHYRVVADNIFVTPVNGADMTFTTPIGPDATTNAATSTGANGATLNGTVNAQNASTTVTFEYGVDTNYGQTVVADQSPLTGNTNTAVTNTLNSLIPNTTYHYRVVAQNVNGTNYGADMTFTTTAIGPTVSTDAVSGIGATGATLNGTVNAEGDSTTVTFEYGTTVAYGTTVTADQSPVTGSTNTPVSKGLTGLTTNTTYHYRVVGQNGAGTSNGADMTFTTGTNTPNAATNAASGIGTTSATLNGTANANGSSTTVTFEYGTTTAYGKTATADQSPITGTTDTGVTSTIGGLIASTTYHYRVVAQNAFGTTNGADMTFLTAGNAPNATTDAATSISSSSATLNGTVNANSDSTTVTFEYGTTTAYGTTATASPSPVTGNTDTAVSYALTGLTDNVTYHYRVVGQNAYGTSNGADMTFTTDTISIPTVSTTSISNITTSSATSGGDVTNGGLGTVTARGVCWSTSPNPTISDSTTSDGSGTGSFTSSITGLTPNTTYYVRAYATNSSGTGYGAERVFTTSAEAELSLNRIQMNFGAVPNNGGFAITPDQTLFIDNSGGATLSWSISSDASWLSASPAAGTGSGIVSVGVDPTSLSAGTYTGKLMVEGTTVITDSAVVNVTLVVYASGSTTPSFGTFSTPVSGSTVRSSVPVTGWVLDDIGTSSVKIYRNSVATDQLAGTSSMVYVGDASFVDGARPDVEEMYPNLPLNYQAGWGYMLLTNILPADGTYTLYAIATDVEGNETTLGNKIITVDNASAVKPFGTIDTPGQGGFASGSNFINFGWALTPQPNTIPIDGSTINVWVDGLPLNGHPVYNQFRQDIADMFPGYNNSDGAVGYIYIDTTAYANGIHTIAWSVQDDANNIAGIGSRYFSIQNIGSGSSSLSSAQSKVTGFPSTKHIMDNLTVEFIGPLTARRGFGTDEYRNTVELLFNNNQNGAAKLMIEELEPVQIQSAFNHSGAKGYHIIDGRLAQLPIGSTFNELTGTFSWLPGPGFVGLYRFMFVFETANGQFYKKAVDILIEPKFNKSSVAQELDLEKQASKK